MSDTSPKPVKFQLDFPQAMEQVALGKKVTRKMWNTNNVFGVLREDILMIRRDDTFKHWIISAGDMSATDWVIID